MTTSRAESTSVAASATMEAEPAPPPSPPRRRAARAKRQAASTATAASPDRNEVRLGGRIAAEAEERELPSGDRIVTLRVVVARAPATGRRREPVDGPRRASVDTIDVVCWSAATRRTALRLKPGEHVELEGALRRRFFGGPSGRQSRYEVEAAGLRRASGGAPAGT